MKAKAPNFEFDPSIRIFSAGQHLLVVFDSQSPHDAQRATRTVRIPKAFKQLSLVVSGFDVAEDDGHQRALKGAASLAIEEDAGALSHYELAALQLMFHADTDRKGSLTHIDPALVAYKVRQALSECLNDALNDYLQRDEAERVGAQAEALPPVAVGAQYPAAAPQPSRKALREQAASDAARQDKSRRRKAVLAWVVPPILVIAVLSTLSHLASTQSPIENAVAQQMANDPESIKAQVELTKQTLQSMGLDPGQGGDLGCLAPQ
ncbi:hypothetical protein J2W83_001717 [Pseudomonas hunanensis]|uniref:Uncharacterized protein n=1 Tax=Pseudomonas hunanensis TaxID=1247546 RepID=A0ACC6K105_9PSED|nr:hypothetical protein [Pseudomonas hunanensis]MDR6712122.1 hypothetical protein [Pseudomonas hunanensis]